jgi:hypothetical protein
MMDSSTGWIAVEQEKVNRPIKTKIRGVPVQVMLSPSDIPSWLRAVVSHNDGKDKIIIELKYLSNQEPTSKDVSDSVVVEVGKHSRRLFSVAYLLSEDLEVSDVEKLRESALAITRELHKRGKISEGNASALGNVFDPKHGEPNIPFTSLTL